LSYKVKACRTADTRPKLKTYILPVKSIHATSTDKQLRDHSNSSHKLESISVMLCIICYRQHCAQRKPAGI